MPIVLSLASLAVVGIQAARGLISETREVEPAARAIGNNVMGVILVGTAAFVLYKQLK